jgi:glutathione synthase/RimK-type ligase-like ATP-grasp enzyme
MAILVTSVGEHPEVEYWVGVLEDRDIDVVRLDVTDWPGTTVSWSPQDDHVTFDERIDWGRIDGAYVHPKSLFRSYSVRKFFEVDDVDSVFSAIHCMRDHRTVFESLFRTLESKHIDVLPAPRLLRLQMRKPWQLQQFEKRGLPVPDTVFTNDPDRVREFYDDHDRTVYKPTTFGPPARELTDDDLTDEKLGKLANAPIQLQEFAPGDDVRVYVLDGEIVGAMRYESESYSFKLDRANERSINVEPATVSPELETTAVEGTDAVGLTFGAADIRRSDDDHALLELNEAPAFAAADTEADQSVGEALADYLVDDS